MPRRQDDERVAGAVGPRAERPSSARESTRASRRPDRLGSKGFRASFGGKPFFVLVADGGDRDARAAARAPRAARRAAGGDARSARRRRARSGELRAIVAGCGLGDRTTRRRACVPDGWAAIDAGDTTVWLRQIDGALARRGRQARTARRRIRRLRRRGGPSRSVSRAHGVCPGRGRLTDLTIRLSQVDVNEPLEHRRVRGRRSAPTRRR